VDVTRKLKVMNIYSILEIIEEKPAMYMGKKSITYMNTFIHGCLTALSFNNIEEEDPPFGHFTNWVARKYKRKFPFGEPTIGWENIILQRVKDEVKAVDEFYRLLRIFKKRVPTEKKHIFLTSDHKPTELIRVFMKGKELPISIPAQMKIVQYSSDKGFYLYYIQQSGKRTNDQYFETEEEAIEKAYKEFGIRKEEWVNL
jgi:hypothetical protein